MNIAILKNNLCINAAVFDDLLTAKTFLNNGVFHDADAITTLPDDCTIGDSFIDGHWIKQPEPPSSVPVIP